jgi:hypothetical protein
MPDLSRCMGGPAYARPLMPLVLIHARFEGVGAVLRTPGPLMPLVFIHARFVGVGAVLRTPGY